VATVLSRSSETEAALARSLHLTFRLGDLEYGVPILAVQEIKGPSPITPLPNAPAHLAGVMNLRGMIVPVVDLRVKFALPRAESGRGPVIILVAVGSKVVGMMVDTVSEVLDLSEAEIQAVPDLGRPIEAGFVRGLAQAGDRLIVLLDVARLLDSDERLAPAASR